MINRSKEVLVVEFKILVDGKWTMEYKFVNKNVSELKKC